MGQCNVCRDFLHPDYCMEMEEGIYKCVYCYLDKDTITIEDTETGETIPVSKQVAKENYKKFVKKIYKSKGVQELVSPKGDKG